MTIYLIGGAVFFIVLVYFYAKNQGFKDAALDYLEGGIETANRVDENDKEKDREVAYKVERYSGDNALKFCLRKSKSEEPKDVSDSKEA